MKFLETIATVKCGENRRHFLMKHDKMNSLNRFLIIINNKLSKYS